MAQGLKKQLEKHELKKTGQDYGSITELMQREVREYTVQYSSTVVQLYSVQQYSCRVYIRTAEEDRPGLWKYHRAHAERGQRVHSTVQLYSSTAVQCTAVQLYS